jgi:hypothetical protein
MYDSDKTGICSSDNRHRHSVVTPFALCIACCSYDSCLFLDLPSLPGWTSCIEPSLGYVLAACTAHGKVSQIDFVGHPVNKKTMACVRLHYSPVHITYRNTMSLRTVTALVFTKCEWQWWSPSLMLRYSAGNASVLPALGLLLRRESS